MLLLPFSRPAAIAQVRGGSSAPNLTGTVSFAPFRGGVLVTADISGLPQQRGACATPVFGFHIHEGSACTGQGFADTGGHFDLTGCPHPHHSGDLPPLFSCRGRAYLAVYTDRFRIRDVIGRTVVIHGHADDFATQPSGHSGEKIACGVIRALPRGR